MKKLIVLALSLGLMVNCSKNNGKNYTIAEVNGVNVYKNLDKPSREDFEISPRQVLRIEGINDKITDKDREFTWPRYLDVDTKGNIFILDIPTASVKKFDQSGNFIKSFGRSGMGPGEIKYPYLLTILNDTIYIPDPFINRMNNFDTDGNFIGHFRINGMPNLLQPVGKDKFIAFMNSFYQTSEGIISDFSLVLMNRQFQLIAVLREYKKPVDRQHEDVLDRFTAFAVSRDKIYVAQNSETKYHINVFDFNGKLQYGIEKEYHKILFRKEELQELNEGLKSLFKKVRNPNFHPVKATYKKAINYMHCDKDGRLLVVLSIERNNTNQFDYLVDVFRDGIFLKQVKLGVFKGKDFLNIHEEKIFFKGNRIYYLDEPEAVLRVFEY